ncbi:hypothetical protein L7F22_037777 [Adiantum nelumboides]|nr:hypothetical protein [Adiantum nelumboides]
MFKLFKELDPVEAITSWEECRSHYNITDEIYNSLFISCTQWLHLKLQKTKETPAIPEVTKGYVQWIIAQKNGTSRLQFSLPWTIKCVGKNLEGIEFIQGEDTSTARVGVCIIDTTHKGTISSGWSAAQFGKVIDGVCRIAHQPSEFVIVGLVKYQHAASLEKAISEKAKWYELYALPLGSLIAAGIVQPTALREVTFGVWAFFSQEEQFTNHSSLKESLFQPMSTLGIDDKDEFDALTTAKSFFVWGAIKEGHGLGLPAALALLDSRISTDRGVFLATEGWATTLLRFGVKASPMDACAMMAGPHGVRLEVLCLFGCLLLVRRFLSKLLAGLSKVLRFKDDLGFACDAMPSGQA